MKSNLDLTVIIPINNLSDSNFNAMLRVAMASIENNKYSPKEVIIVHHTSEEISLLNINSAEFTFPFRLLENTESNSFQGQINFAVKDINTKYFTFLEFDDEFSINWFNNVKIYTDAYPEIDMFLPIISDFTNKGEFIGYTNEAAWAFNFSDTLGYIDHEVLLEYPNINPDGMVINTEAFKLIGGYKSNIKLTFNYEFLLRATEMTKTIMVIPKIGYKHTNMRESSLFWDYKNSTDVSIKIEPEEAIFWMDAAKKEFYYTNDRDIKYGQNEDI